MHILEEKVRAANAKGRRALIPFLTANFPDEEKFWEAVGDLDANGADVIEIGVPFSDPVADGPVVEEASRRVLSRGFEREKLLDELAGRKFYAGIVLMGYYNPFLQYGLSKLAHDAKKAGVAGFIIPDLPYEEAEPFRKALEGAGMALIPLVGPNTPPERMELYAKSARGYVYVVSVMGTTGARQGLPPQIADTIELARQKFAVPVALGFGLREPAQLAGLSPRAMPDAAVFGSALLTHLDSGRKAGEFIAKWL